MLLLTGRRLFSAPFGVVRSTSTTAVLFVWMLISVWVASLGDATAFSLLEQQQCRRGLLGCNGRSNTNNIHLRSMRPSSFQHHALLSTTTTTTTTTQLYNSTPRKKRRRKTDDDAADNDDSSISDRQTSYNSEDEEAIKNMKNGDLPDFDLMTETDEASVSNALSKQISAEKGAPLVSLMQGGMPSATNQMAAPSSSSSTTGAEKSVQDLLQDRSLERKLEFLESNDNNALPDLLAATTSDSASAPLSKRDRQMARRQELQMAAAREKTGNNNDDAPLFGNLLSQLPGIRNDQGQIAPLKILENATWACIWALVLWEVYLNSPFFERAAPMAPVVY